MHCSYELVYMFNHILIYCYVSVMYTQPSYIYLVVAYVTCKYRIFELYFFFFCFSYGNPHFM